MVDSTTYPLTLTLTLSPMNGLTITHIFSSCKFSCDRLRLWLPRSSVGVRHDAPASRAAGAAQTAFPRWSVTAIKLSASCSVTMFFLSAMEIE